MGKEETIDLIDLMLQLLRKWRTILIWMLICALLMNGYAGFKSYKVAVASQQALASGEDVRPDYMDNLTDEDMNKAEAASKLYASYEKSYNASLDYYKNSLKMQIDANKVPKEVIQYHIEPEKNADDIVTAFSGALQSQTVCEKIKTHLGTEEDISYLGELITLEEREDKYPSDIIVEKDKITSVMLVSVIAPDRKMCESIADVLEEEAAIKAKELQKSLDNFNLTYIDRNYSENADGKLLLEQQDCLYGLRDLKTAMDNLKTSLTEDQKIYFNELLRQETDQTDEAATEQEPISVTYINVKYILIGLFAGLFLSGGWYLVLYVLDRRLLTVQQLEECSDIRILDTITTNTNPDKKKCVIDRWIDKIFRVEPDTNTEKDNKVKMICANIQVFAQKKNMAKVHITSVSASREVTEIKQAILAQNTQTGIELTAGESILSNHDSLTTLAASDGVVLVERVRDSILKDIEKEIEICKSQGIPIIGVVAMN